MIDNPFSLQNKKILITGASSGIGRAMAIECAKAGANVIITGRNILRLQETYSLLAGAGHIIIHADLNLSSDIERLADEIPPINGVVHNAGVNKRVVCQFIKEGDLQQIAQTNMCAPILLQRQILKKKKLVDGSSVVFTSSISMWLPSVGNAIYSATKGAITAYAKVLAVELAPRQIRVNCIHPGMVCTDLIRNSAISDDYQIKDMATYPLKRYGKPEEVAYMAVYLLSDAAAWVTGSSMIIDGGRSII